MQEHMKIIWHYVWAVGGMIELFPAKCHEILRCSSSSSVWAGVVINHHKTRQSMPRHLFWIVRRNFSSVPQQTSALIVEP